MRRHRRRLFPSLRPKRFLLAVARVGHLEVTLHFADETAELEPRHEAVAGVGELLDPARLLGRGENVRRRGEDLDHVGLELEEIDPFQEHVVAGASDRRLLYIENEVWVRPPSQGQTPLRRTGSSPTQAIVAEARFGSGAVFQFDPHRKPGSTRRTRRPT